MKPLCDDCGVEGALPRTYHGNGKSRSLLCGSCARLRVALREIAGEPRPCQECGAPANLLEKGPRGQLVRRCGNCLVGQPYGFEDSRPSATGGDDAPAELADAMSEPELRPASTDEPGEAIDDGNEEAP